MLLRLPSTFLLAKFLFLFTSSAAVDDVPHILSDVDTKCPDDWQHADGKCYRLYPIERSWPQALAFCARFGANLARIESERENAYVAKLVAKPQRSVGASAKADYWIGFLSQQQPVGQPEGESAGASFVWSNGAFASRYVGFWAIGQPNLRSGSCTKASLQRSNNLEWRLEMCNLLLPFICEIPSCVKGQFFCHNGGCVPERAHCNGVDDCGDLSDELNCPASRAELACLKHDKGESGRLESPNFPTSYPSGANCRWVIEGPINSRIQLTFDSFETEENQDYVTVLDGGPAENSTMVLSQLSGMPRPERLSFTSSTNQMIVRFRADALIHARGFQAAWKAVQIGCGGVLTAQSYAQAFTSTEHPRTYPNGMECVWIIEATDGDLISLTIDSLDLEEDRDFLIVYDGGQPSAPVIARMSGASGRLPTIITSQSRAYVYFFSDHAVRQREHSGFSITYSKGCNNVAHDKYGTIVSPGYLSVPYPSSRRCQYTIEVPPDAAGGEQSITLAVNSFNLADDDFLKVYEGGIGGRSLHDTTAAGSGSEEGFNGVRRPPKLLYAKKSKVALEFVTNSAHTSLGFNITYSINCAPLVVPDTVSISTHNIAYGTKVTISCTRGFEFVTGRGRFFDVFCQLGGQWTESILPECQPVFCAPVPQIANGFAISATNVSFGGMARYGCNDGFGFASGRKTEEVFCTDEGRWTSTPQCRAETCSALVAFQNGKRVLRFGDGTGYGSVYEFECTPGYRREGAATILCQADGRWSSPQPFCKKLSCTDLPRIENGQLLIPQGDLLYFGDSALVECYAGFRRVGADLIKCLANQTLSAAPLCEDVDECAEQTANCAQRGTICVNLSGGYHCQCLPGYKPQLSCASGGALSPIAVKASSGTYTLPPSIATVGVVLGRSVLPNSPSTTQTPASIGKGWCADVDDAAAALTFTFAAPKIIEKLRVEKVGGRGFPTALRVFYASEIGRTMTALRVVSPAVASPPAGRFERVDDANETTLDIFTDLSTTTTTTVPTTTVETADLRVGETTLFLENIASTGSAIVALPQPIEARVLRVEIVTYEERACAKIDIIGCQKSNCVDINECDENNGYCEHNCHNLPGSHRCSCHEGYDLLLADGQGELRLRDGETGTNDLDVLRFNKSCVARRCAALDAPTNGKIISAMGVGTLARRFAFPEVVEFVCDFGHQMRGPSHLMCLADGTWNGTAPMCIPASCVGAKNNSAIGLFVQPDSPTIAYGQNVSVYCSQQNRPGRSSSTANTRQCIYDPRSDGVDYWLSGPEIDCPLVDCGPPPALAGSYYEDAGDEDSNKVGGAHLFHCRPPYVLVGKSSYDDRMVRCNVDGTWDLGDLRCEGPVCPDPGFPADGDTLLTSVEESAVARFTCRRPGYRPFPGDSINCTLGTPCVLSEDVGISTGFIPDGAFGDNSDTTIWGYEPHKSRMSSTGWCGSKDAFIFLSVDLQRIYTLTTLRLAGVAASGHLKGHVTKMQLFHKVQFSQNYDNYAKEFTTPSGNHNKMYEFTLNPPVRARYILLGITEYETNPCLRFDMQGCLAPLSPSHEIPSHLQVGWNASIPLCLDAEPPTFINCPAAPIYASTDEHGQLLPISYAVPEARDNSGIVAHVQVRPEDFEPPQPIQQNIDVVYTAFDEAGNSADCVVRLRIPDTQPPVMKCPESYALWADDGETARRVFFNETAIGQQLLIQDMSNITELRFDPPEALLRLGDHVTVEVSASDAYLNRNRCRFQIALMAEPCSSGSLTIDEKSTTKRCSKQGTATVCVVECRAGYRLHDTFSLISTIAPAAGQQQRFSCTVDGRWSPVHAPLACVPAAQEPARYELKVKVNYAAAAPVPSECLEGYQYLISGFFDSIDTILTQRCSSSIQVFVRLLDVKLAAGNEGRTAVTANYTVQVLPTVLQKVFYQLCGLTLQTIFDLRVPGATTPIRSLLAVSGDATGTSGCPSLNATTAITAQDFQCLPGEILRYPSGAVTAPAADANSPLPECLPCPKGTVFVENTCAVCPLGSYQDEEGKNACKSCPDATHTLVTGAQSVNACMPICGDGMYSNTGTIPCQLCPRHTFAGSPISGGFRQCENCPEGTYTARLGSTSVSECKLPCQTGHFSATGLEPCSPCPANTYQSTIGQQRCLACANDTMSGETGRSAAAQCQALDCSAIKCQNKGTCTIRNHKEVCQCRPGFTGRFCEEVVPICNSLPCYNGGVCEPVGGTFRCTCPQNFTGARCQFGPDECVGVNCPNGGVCQDLPGIGTKKCVCRTGFTGSDCSEIADPCHSQNPCKNGADCVPLQLGRLKCKCLPGWEGQFCEKNTDDCAEGPCALGSPCRDLLNDFECDCPPGFTGKRCNVKADLCNPDPCLNGGTCVDALHERRCVCRAGWTGAFCEQNVDECAAAPCQNGAVCRDQENGHLCECAPGFHGSQCQHMIDHCAVSPCRNNATCVNRGANYECECRLGFDGVHCEHNVDECALSKCDPQGTETCEDLVNDFICHCRAGFSGELCRTRVNECDMEPCQNNGTCISTSTGFECECRAGWRGNRCQELETHHCDQKPCQNDGQCVSLVGDFFCVCPEGVNGKRCEITPNRCLGEPCHNSGVCGDFGSRLECTCPRGFVGAGCQYRRDACRTGAEGACKNGGVCLPTTAGKSPTGPVSALLAEITPQHSAAFKCECPPGFTGSECETEINECQPNPCPMAASCVDQLNGHYCRCSFNSTGANCEKRVDPDYDFHFYGGAAAQAARASLAAPVRLTSVDALTVSLWVRFERRRSKATVLTLYHSERPNYAWNLSEAIRVAGDSVRLALFPDIQPLLLRLPANHRLDDGRWNSLIVTWRAAGGEYSLVWNAVRIFAERGYGTQRQLNVNAFVNLGDPLSTEKSERMPGKTPAVFASGGEHFTGSVTRVNLWTRVLDFEQEIPVIVQQCQGTPDIFSGLALRFAGYDNLVGKVERITRSSCGRVSTVTDILPVSATVSPSVRVLSCPRDIFVVTPLKEVNITWPEPSFSGMTLERVEHNLKSGQVFTWGRYTALYVAYANDSSTAECTFKIHVTREFCAEPEDPVNGVQSCERWGPELRYRACSIHCEAGHAFTRPPAVFYVCAEDGAWRPRDAVAGRRRFRYPSCTRTVAAERVARIHLNYPQLKLCNFAGKNTIIDKITQKVRELNAKWGICATMGSGTIGNSTAASTCDGIRIVVDCVDAAQSHADSEATRFLRRHRHIAAGDGMTSAFGVRVEVPVRGETLAADPLAAAGENSTRRMNALELLEHEALINDFFNLEQVLPNGKPDLASIRFQSGFTCQHGYVTVGESCVPCAPGSYFSGESGGCELCPAGTFQPRAGKTECETCSESQPVTAGAGATSAAECKERCFAGNYFSEERDTCEPCGYGFFQPADGAFDCQPCGVGKTTLEATARSEDECRDECADGEQMTRAGSCQACPVGTYRSRGVDKRCVACPAGTTTEAAAATRKSQCNTPVCAPGQFLVAVSKQCQMCPRGAYQDEAQQATCKLCSVDFTTAAEGATHESQCYSTNQCKMGEDNCSWKATCIDLPDENDVPSFRCECNAGYRGNGTYCVDACLNHCLNDGVCRKNRVTSREECVCKENFSGERCEIRFQPRAQRLALWVAAAGAGVLLLVVIVVVIGMISVRFNRARSRYPDKPMMGMDASMASNFLYGRPALDAAGGGGANSAFGSFNRTTMGFYYEDDAAASFDFGRSAGRRNGGGKSMFVGSGGPTDANPTNSNNNGRRASTVDDAATLSDVSELGASGADALAAVDTGSRVCATPIIAVGNDLFAVGRVQRSMR